KAARRPPRPKHPLHPPGLVLSSCTHREVAHVNWGGCVRARPRACARILAGGEGVHSFVSTCTLVCMCRSVQSCACTCAGMGVLLHACPCTHVCTSAFAHAHGGVTGRGWTWVAAPRWKSLPGASPAHKVLRGSLTAIGGEGMEPPTRKNPHSPSQTHCLSVTRVSQPVPPGLRGD
uniref:Uncharacterized protein n=1 Tax=Cairina moschata TaxID=8855 RepID=A0A8C3BK04_CAIMO